jgi:hypothetical protein
LKLVCFSPRINFQYKNIPSLDKGMLWFATANYNKRQAVREEKAARPGLLTCAEFCPGMGKAYPMSVSRMETLRIITPAGVKDE